MLGDPLSTPQGPKNRHMIGGEWISWGLVESFETCSIARLRDHRELLYELFFVGNVTQPGDASSNKFGGKIGHVTKLPKGHVSREDWWGGEL